MQCPLIDIFTGMRNTDSINENQSYFFAELLRLHNIVEELKTGKRLLILLDEILKGTNSGDKLSGSLELMQQLSQYDCIGMVATHDIDLGVLEAKLPGKIANWHFETFIKGDELSFDYTLHPGVSTSKNATFLMKKMGIIPDGKETRD
jgi:DNA mismatch repair ATPase MutS